jgi:hypothetical protein
MRHHTLPFFEGISQLVSRDPSSSERWMSLALHVLTPRGRALARVGWPLYLQPIGEEGHYPWMESGESNRINAGTSRSLPSQDPKDKAESVGPAQSARKRKSTDDSMPGDSPVRQGKKHKAVRDSSPRVRQSRGPRKRSQVKRDTIMEEER